MIKVNNKIVEIKRFPDKTLNIKGDSSLTDGKVLITWHYENDAEFMAIVFLTKYYKTLGNEVMLYLPYVPNARMDRVEESGDVFSMKYFGELINSLGFKKVYVLDVHSSVACAVIKNCYLLPSESFVRKVIFCIKHAEKTEPIIVYPDEGAMKRYNKEVNLPYAFGIKKRDWETGKLLSLEIFGLTEEEIKDKPILIRDDICSKGGTFYYTAKKLKEMGAGNIYLYATHCENNIHYGEFGDEKVNLINSGLVKGIFTTNSIYTMPDMENICVYDIGIVLEDKYENQCRCKYCDNCVDCDDDGK